jgi:hypothetical protein
LAGMYVCSLGSIHGSGSPVERRSGLIMCVRRNKACRRIQQYIPNLGIWLSFFSLLSGMSGGGHPTNAGRQSDVFLMAGTLLSDEPHFVLWIILLNHFPMTAFSRANALQSIISL